MGQRSASRRAGISRHAGVWHALGRDEESKVFFFEKKKQKTFGALSRTLRQRTPSDKSFLVLFFKKEPLSSFLPAYVTNRNQMYSPLALRETGYICNPEFSR
jgi:hypothetical protein